MAFYSCCSSPFESEALKEMGMKRLDRSGAALFTSPDTEANGESAKTADYAEMTSK